MGLPSGVVVVNSYMVSAVEPATRSLSTPVRHLDGGCRRTTAQPDAHGLPREAGGRQKRLLGAYVGFPNSGPPSSTCSHRQARSNPSGTRLGTTTPVEHSNSKRIRSLDGSRPRIESPVTSSKGRPGHPQRLLSLKEAAAMLGLSPASIRRLISARRLPTVRILRRIQLDSRDLERLIDQSKER